MFCMLSSKHRSCCKALLLGMLCLPLVATAGTGTKSLLDMNIEELMELKVVSAMRKPQSVADTASAIYVITQEDIRRSGATSLPEMLRMAPGVEVARLNGHKWAVTIRGFNGEFADKLLVMIDGRTVYTPLHGGVYWDVQDFVAEDVDRIEIIRGPGGSLWGTNAINGIINVITKSSYDTQGGLVVVGAGDEEQGFVTLRHGGKASDSGDYRVYLKGFKRKNGEQFYTNPQIEQWNHVQGGFRTDWQLSDSQELTVQGDYYRATEGLKTSLTSLTAPYNSTIADVVDLTGGNLVTHWTKALSSTSQLDLQFYYDHTHRAKQSFTELRNTYDLDFQHRFNLTEGHELVWGLGYRLSEDETRDSFFSSITPANEVQKTASAVIQDEMSFLDDRLRFTIGSKFEHNQYTGTETLPSMRVLWRGDGSYSLWATASRAVRIPSRAERDLTHNVVVLRPDAMWPGSPITPITVLNNTNFGAMHVDAYEIGGRGKLADNVSLDIALFNNFYTDLGAIEQQGFTYQLTNAMEGTTIGGELLVRWAVTDSWKIISSYSLLKVRLKALNANVTEFVADGDSPDNQFKLQSSWDLSENIELDAFFYRNSAASAQVDAYDRIDLRLAWLPTDDLEISLVGQNLFNPKHIENSTYEVPSSAYAKVSWSY